MNYLIGLNEKQINFLFDVLDHMTLADENEPKIKLLGDIRERLVLGRYGRVLRADIPAIRAGEQRTARRKTK